MRLGARGDKLRSRASDEPSGALFVHGEVSRHGSLTRRVLHSANDMPSSAVPDLGTLRSICQGEKVRQDRRPWYVFTRRVSIGITWLLLHTPVTANQVTVVSLLLTLVGPALIAMPSAALALLGAGALVVHYFLDKVDGEIARFRKVYSLAGVYMDELSHTFAYAGTFAGLGIHLAWRAQTPAEAMGVLGAALLGAMAMVMIRQNKSMGALLFAQSVLEQPQLLPASEGTGRAHFLSREGVRQSRSDTAGGGGRPGAAGLVALVRDLVLTISEFTFVLVLVLVGLAIEAATGNARFLDVMLRAQALLQAAVLLALIWINHSFNLENECRRLDELALKRARERIED
jgi:phosphatidylglycerophosphate synthase